MSNLTTKSPRKISVPVPLDELAESIWRLPKRERESLEDLLEDKFVRTVLKRAKEIPRLRRQKKLLSFDQLQRDLARR